MASKKSETLISISAAEKVMKASGAERVSEEAKKELVSVLEEYGKKIGKQALKISNFSGRKTVQKKDIDFSVNNQD